MMRWQKAGLAILALIGTTNCPHSFGRGGTVDRAIHKDTLELYEAGCTDEERIRVCKGKSPEECAEICD
ncbi:hypothetical protein SAMN05443639_106190 [Stigmatella erecta]|uniref:Uncharacterized protein n=1 Tax=Stigmatella erecta TaxID=83460 RepID=A0A1I0IR10_9BACT|nr:hypothetical protein SAMN05443639_106190 [Stigmatella erecta]